MDNAVSKLVFYENLFPPVKISKKEGLTQLRYEIYINVLSAHSGITINNPVMMSMSFLKRKDKS